MNRLEDGTEGRRDWAQNIPKELEYVREALDQSRSASEIRPTLKQFVAGLGDAINEATELIRDPREQGRCLVEPTDQNFERLAPARSDSLAEGADELRPGSNLRRRFFSGLGLLLEVLDLLARETDGLHLSVGEVAGLDLQIALHDVSCQPALLQGGVEVLLYSRGVGAGRR